ncbi:gfo/Idh/MocA family oxidoreductase [Actinobacteria bacterium YIM 96077]|uniref:Gfo/Idh/MocA family oxidoreductase n=1 Tax=Phytoactinopolyspora halophila TaxID=1981511 RepID=A0A329QG31_9ACTN|nr:Gfo/Idh/MocA family oxidoreductase [Phytoactinopolyspora halophila]AYY13112.1 gfo/Idh/MocA family oxidoreductase [Actinobacteria bacterium YIM 96077]RAW11176.1 gfo/Idh/MocA family oxidoreductase [Phytoactinopolyspora halophila]
MTDDSTATLGIGMVGYSFMGVVHSHAWRNVRSFFDVPLVPRLAALAGRNVEAATAVADKFGWEHVESDWRALLARDDVDLVDVCTPGDTHAEIAIAALDAGKHVLCEKPLANSVSEAAEMAAAAARARQAGVRAMVGFTYRRVPAIVLARNLVAEGRIGEIRHVRAQYLQDWLVDRQAPMSWRLEKSRAGSGALGDIGAHIVDLTQFITGEQITGVSALMETFVKQRPAAEPAAEVKLGGHVDAGDAPLADVTVDDAAVFTGRFSGGALATFEATRYAAGRKNAIRIEINGSLGSLAFDFEDMNVLHFYDDSESSQTAGFRRILVTEPDHPFLAAWWPPGHLLGYEHGFTHQAVDLVTALADGRGPEPTFDDGLRVQQVLAAVEQSAAKDSAWTVVGG